MTRIQKVLCVFLCLCMLGAAGVAASGCFSLPQKKTCHAQDFWKLVPLYAYCQEMDAKDTFSEDNWTCEKIIESNQAYLENKVLDENQEGQEITEAPQETEEEDSHEAPYFETAVTPNPVLDLSPERLADFDYLMSNFFILDPNTSTDANQINAARFLEKDMRLSQDSSKPQILIYHSHSQEGFTDTQPDNVETTVVGVGNYLASLLQERYGYQVIHITDTFDVVDGEIDRNRAYDFAREKVEQVLEENPSIEVVIDLHRDGVDESRHLVTDIDGKPTAQIMCFNGLSYTANNGPVEYLPNPYIQDNLAFSFQLEMEAAKYYPELYRGIYLAGLRYNLHLRPKAILLEAGAQTNSVEEVKNAMEPFADILHRVLSGENKSAD